MLRVERNLVATVKLGFDVNNVIFLVVVIIVGDHACKAVVGETIDNGFRQSARSFVATSIAQDCRHGIRHDHR